jgi:hypothetical protein
MDIMEYIVKNKLISFVCHVSSTVEHGYGKSEYVWKMWFKISFAAKNANFGELIFCRGMTPGRVKRLERHKESG